MQKKVSPLSKSYQSTPKSCKVTIATPVFEQESVSALTIAHKTPINAQILAKQENTTEQ